MAEFRLFRSWNDDALKRRLEAIGGLERNFEADPAELGGLPGWEQYYSEAIVAQEAPGETCAETWDRACAALSSYAFSDRRIVVAHFDPDVPLLGRRMLLEMRAFRVFRYLAGVVVGAVRDEKDADCTVFGFRYDTLQGHIERGAEWFVLTKDHGTGAIRLRIEAVWQPGDFPNAWSRLGFSLFGRHYQRRWHRHAHELMLDLAHDPAFEPPDAEIGMLVHSPPEVAFQRNKP